MSLRSVCLTTLLGLSFAAPAQAATSTVFVPGTSNLLNDWLYPYGGDLYDATPVPGVEVSNGALVTLSATGCAIDDGSNCTGPDGYAFDWNAPGLRVYALIGAWSTSASELTGASVVGSAFTVGSSATLTAPAGPGPYYLFLGDNDGQYSDNGAGYTVTINWSAAVSDADEDGVADDVDNCPDDANVDQADDDEDGVGDACDLCWGDDDAGDYDEDFTCDDEDNCPVDANEDQEDEDVDGIGNVCEADTDGDGTIDDDDNCADGFNPTQSDNDDDGYGDVCDADDDNDGDADAADNCPVIPNSDQADFDGDGQGDACDGDDDSDGVIDEDDSCPSTPFDAVYNDAGCSGEQLVDLACFDRDPCLFSNQGQFQSCVTHAANAARDQGLLTNTARATIVKNAARARCQ